MTNPLVIDNWTQDHMTASLTVALTIPMITCSHFSALEMTWRLHFWLVNSFSKESQFRFRMTKFSGVVSQSMIHFPLMLLVKLYLIENTVFNKHSAFCIFNSILQMILSLTCVKLKEIAEFRFTSDLWKSSVNSHMLYLVPGMTPVVSAGKGSPAHGHTYGTEMEGLLSASPWAGFGVVWHCGHLAESWRRGTPCAACQGGEGSFSQLSALQCFP